ncbi:hypothetical protein [Altererythrobacter sp. C41]|uniref:hypothetical protein n=1 Tax=Altererythrobacter sp. C41 TaxID=2806021 RepID=UPI0019335BAC|nr:hypothetical protein [Altererythrobacter sp. C41]MBM0169665.1 hypothetical protein [Altererythrobacter sp. C41]
MGDEEIAVLLAQGQPSANWERHLSAKEGQALTEFLREKIGEHPCEMCGHAGWSVNPSLASPLLLSIDFENRQVGAPMTDLHPCAMIHCAHCGNTKLHSLHHLGFDIFAARDTENG